MDDLQLRLAALDRTSRRAILQDLAIEELGRQKQRIETYQVQARFELAAIYDKTANKPSEKPQAAPHPGRGPAGRQAEEKDVPARRGDARGPRASWCSGALALGRAAAAEQTAATIKDLEGAAGRCQPRSAAGRRQQQDHGQLQALSRL